MNNETSNLLAKIEIVDPKFDVINAFRTMGSPWNSIADLCDALDKAESVYSHAWQEESKLVSDVDLHEGLDKRKKGVKEKIEDEKALLLVAQRNKSLLAVARDGVSRWHKKYNGILQDAIYNSPVEVAERKLLHRKRLAVAAAEAATKAAAEKANRIAEEAKRIAEEAAKAAKKRKIQIGCGLLSLIMILSVVGITSYVRSCNSVEETRIHLNDNVPESLSQIIIKSKQTGNYARVLVKLDELLQAQPKDQRLLLTKFQILCGPAKNPQNAILLGNEMLQMDIESDVLNQVALLSVTEIPRNQRDLDFSLSAATKAVSLSESMEPLHLDTLALVYFERGNKPQAAATQTQAIELGMKQNIDPIILEKFNSSLQTYKSKNWNEQYEEQQQEKKKNPKNAIDKAMRG